MRKGNLPQWILAAFLFIYLFIYFSVWHYVEKYSLKQRLVPEALHAGAFKDALTSETSKSADDQKIFFFKG